MMVKICGITNYEDAHVAVEEGAAALGFVFYERSPRRVDPLAAAAIISRLPAAVWKAGVFVNEPPETVRGIMKASGLDIAQLHGDETPADVPRGMRVWKALRVGEEFEERSFDGYDVEAFLLDAAAGGEYGGTGRTFPWRIVRNAQRKIVLAGGLDASNVADAIREARPWGVDASSRLEAELGRKDHVKLRAFLKAALLNAPGPVSQS